MLWLALIAIALPMAAFANSGGVDFTNSGGTLTGSSVRSEPGGSVLIAVNGLNGLVTGNYLGSIAFTTGAMTSGDLQMGGMFDGGGSFMIMGNGTGGNPNGMIFNGSFHGPVIGTLVTLANGTHNYTLTGDVMGTWYTGSGVFGATVQLTINTAIGFFNGTTTISSGDTKIAAVPKPDSLTLLGTGLVGLAGILRAASRKP